MKKNIQTSTVVYEFTNEIYPFSVFVGKGISDLAVRKLFLYYDSRSGRVNQFKIWENCLKGVNALCFPVCLNINGKTGMLVNLNPNSKFDAELIAHESCHIADWICDCCKVRYGTYEEGEAHAYIVGMVARFMEMVINNNVPKNVKKWTPTVVNHMLDAELKEDIRTGKIKLDENGNPVF